MSMSVDVAKRVIAALDAVGVVLSDSREDKDAQILWSMSDRFKARLPGNEHLHVRKAGADAPRFRERLPPLKRTDQREAADVIGKHSSWYQSVSGRRVCSAPGCRVDYGKNDPAPQSVAKHAVQALMDAGYEIARREEEGEG